ncbi:MAG: hypothetical protein ACYSUI_20455, partial [Planctomycetota bacterium]
VMNSRNRTGMSWDDSYGSWDQLQAGSPVGHDNSDRKEDALWFHSPDFPPCLYRQYARVKCMPG